MYVYHAHVRLRARMCDFLQPQTYGEANLSLSCSSRNRRNPKAPCANIVYT